MPEKLKILLQDFYELEIKFFCNFNVLHLALLSLLSHYTLSFYFEAMTDKLTVIQMILQTNNEKILGEVHLLLSAEI